MKYKYLFGPVPSRRLSISLGINPTHFKTCTYNCVYCEWETTTNLTTNRKEYIQIKEIIAELINYLYQKPKLDYLTFSGSGELNIIFVLGKLLIISRKTAPNIKSQF